LIIQRKNAEALIQKLSHIYSFPEDSFRIVQVGLQLHLQAFDKKAIDEAITYLGLDRLGLSRPDKAMYRLISKGALHPKKISGHFAFDKKEFDIIVACGDEKRSRGRPRKYHSV